MALPTISEIGRVTADTEIRYTQNGKAVATTRLAFNRSRKNDQTGEWENVATFFVDGTTWEDAAERAAQTLLQGVKVYVTGEIETQSWERDGEKRSKPALNIRRFEVIPRNNTPTPAQHAAPANGGWTAQRPPAPPNDWPPTAQPPAQPAAWDTGNTHDGPPF